jgi:hypothetical protein
MLTTTQKQQYERYRRLHKITTKTTRHDLTNISRAFAFDLPAASAYLARTVLEHVRRAPGNRIFKPPHTLGFHWGIRHVFLQTT